MLQQSPPGTGSPDTVPWTHRVYRAARLQLAAASPDRIAQLGIVLTTLALTWWTWAHWGDVQVNCGRELYLPAEILKGKLLYRDLWYQYGPLAPYLQALIFFLFGVHFTCLYVLGLSIALITALLFFALSRRFVPVFPAFVVSFLFLVSGFEPSIFNYVFPYSYAADMGSLLGLGCAYCGICYVLDDGTSMLVLSSLLAGLALACKQEFGLAGYIFLAVALTLRALKHRSFRLLSREVLFCIPGLAVGILIYAWFVWRLSWRFILQENFVGPGSFFMRKFGSAYVARWGFRFVPRQVLLTVAVAMLALGAWFGIALLLRVCFRGRERALRGFNAVVVVASVGLWWLRTAAPLPIRLAVSTAAQVAGHLTFPTGTFWLACALLAVYFVRTLRSNGGIYDLAAAALAVYALATGLRLMAWVEPWGYGIYYCGPLFLIFVLILTTLVGLRTRALSDLPALPLLNSIFTIEAGLLFFLWWPAPSIPLPARLDTDLGAIYTRPEEAALFPRLAGFMKEQRRLGKRVLVLPEATMLYALSGTDAPSRYYELDPGLLSPEGESKFISEIDRSGVDFILLTNRSYPEYGVPHFGIDYAQTIGRWIDQHYEAVGQFGNFSLRPGAPFAVLLYKRRQTADVGPASNTPANP
ncbi:MAG: hypothetical protein WA005_02730 [Candidatus Binataceae bacterium]